jgi:hypothetical protein
VERFNRTLCEALAKFSNENQDDWDMYVSSALFAYRVRKQSTTRHEPFYLMYGRDAVLPVDFAVKTMQAELHEGDSQDDLLARIRMLTGRVTEDRLMTQDAIYEAQQQQKQRHDENLVRIFYKIGDLVLLYKSQLRGKKKLQDRWKGPYYIHEDLGNGVYKLRTLQGDILKTPVNSERLKLYNQR